MDKHEEEGEVTRTDRVLAYIVDCLQRHGRAATSREIGEEVGPTSTSVVNYHLNKLVQCGLIRREREIARGIRLMGARLVTPGQRVCVSLAEALDPADGTHLPAGTVVVGELVAA